MERKVLRVAVRLIACLGHKVWQYGDRLCVIDFLFQPTGLSDTS